MGVTVFAPCLLLVVVADGCFSPPRLMRHGGWSGHRDAALVEEEHTQILKEEEEEESKVCRVPRNAKTTGKITEGQKIETGEREEGDDAGLAAVDATGEVPV